MEETLEIMSPSRSHERFKSVIGSLLEAYFQEQRIRYFPLGSATFRQQEQRGATETDECYCIGTEKDLLDLAIEVVITSGGISKLSVYKKLGIREVWFWQDNQFEVYILGEEDYQTTRNSLLFPDLNLELLASYVVKFDPLEAVLEWRNLVRSSYPN